jgi:anthranilate synthase component 1
MIFYPTLKEFLKLSKKANIVPVYTEVFNDTLTPVAAYAAIESQDSFLLESVEGGENIGRYSFLGCEPFCIFISDGQKHQIIKKEKKIIFETDDPFEIFQREILDKYKGAFFAELPRFHCGAVGYFGYDLINFIEKLPQKNPQDLKLPIAYLMLADNIIVFDHLYHKIKIISNVQIKNNPEKDYQKALKKIENILKKIINHQEKLRSLDILAIKKSTAVKTVSNLKKESFLNSVIKAKKYIKEGDIFQVVLSQRFHTKTKLSPLNIYRRLRALNPSPYMYFLNFRNLKLIGTSPELMVRLENRKATVRPIAGTRRRGANEKEDQKLEKELLSDAKERAEHLMLLDLGRNDLGRVCEFGSVKTTECMTVEKYSHVMHIISNIEGKLKTNVGPLDLIKATFPAGTVTGAPKVRAMEIIEELENIKRGPYAGCVGYIDFTGNLDTAITIRTIILVGNNAYVQAGAGIVADSDPEKEYEETVNKARAMLLALT